jgi:thioredoxin reductase
MLKCSSVCFELRSEVTKVEGDSFLRRVTIVNGTTGENRDVDICGLLVMIGADPCTYSCEAPSSLTKRDSHEPRSRRPRRFKYERWRPPLAVVIQN